MFDWINNLTWNEDLSIEMSSYNDLSRFNYMNTEGKMNGSISIYQTNVLLIQFNSIQFISEPTVVAEM